jgi:hypothetical protein
MNIKIENFSHELQKRNLAPSNIQFSIWKNWSLVSCFSSVSSQFISESVSMGIDRNPEVALMKGLTEFCERKISIDTVDPIARLTARSDGFAALPKHYELAHKRVQENALNEAIERYLWAKWWDDSSTKFFMSDDYTFANKEQLMLEFNLETISSIHILPSNHNSSLLILIAKIKDGGYVTGGAAGNIQNKEQTFSRAFGELLRHLIVVKEMLTSDYSPSSFYEKRLYGFGNGAWNNIVEDRLAQNGNTAIELPELIANREVAHPNSDFIIVHRCLFNNQPTFMGGDLERLCI